MFYEAAAIMNFRTTFSSALLLPKRTLDFVTKTVTRCVTETVTRCITTSVPKPVFIPVLLMGLCLGACKKPSLPNSLKEVEATPASAPAEPSPAPEPPLPKIRQADTKGSAIVLCYHRFEEKPKDGLAITPAAFESQMQALTEHGFTVIPMQDFLAWRRGEKSIPEKCCLITIDDGYRSGYDVAWPILKKHGFPFTMFIYTAFVKGGALAGGGSISWGELAEMRDAGVDIQSHTVNHQNLRAKKGKFQSQFATYEEWLKNEIAGSKRLIEAQLGISVQAIAYPYGIHGDVIRAIAMESGYEAAFSTYGQRLTYHSPADQLGRYAIESTKPKIFTDALAMVGGGGGGGVGESAAAVSGQVAAVSMVTVPAEGETVHETKPAIKANLATMGEVEPGTVEIRISGVGAVPVKYDPATKLAEAVLLQPLKDKQVTVLLSAQVRGRKVETRWNFVCEAPANSSAPVHGTAVPAGGASPAVPAAPAASTGASQRPLVPAAPAPPARPPAPASAPASPRVPAQTSLPASAPASAPANAPSVAPKAEAPVPVGGASGERAASSSDDAAPAPVSGGVLQR
jgi:peptidoglycan/xylan/chitin deacetylase (PgdA/CDA1 family)